MREIDQQCSRDGVGEIARVGVDLDQPSLDEGGAPRGAASSDGVVEFDRPGERGDPSAGRLGVLPGAHDARVSEVVTIVRLLNSSIAMSAPSSIPGRHAA